MTRPPEHDRNSKFTIAQSSLIVSEPFVHDEYQSEEETFLQKVDQLMKNRMASVTIDLVQAGGLSSTVIALIIAASRKANESNKTLTVRVARRNTLAIQISGLEKLVEIIFI